MMVVCVAFPMAVSGLYDYLVPQEFEPNVVPGIPVKVELRSKKVWGVVISLKERSSHSKLKCVLEVKSEHWTDTSRTLLKLYQWISEYYQCDIGKVFKPLVRKNIVGSSEKSVITYSFSGNIGLDLTSRQKKAADILKNSGKEMTRQELKNLCGISDHMISAMIVKKVLKKRKKRVVRTAQELCRPMKSYNVELTDEQKNAVKRISGSIGDRSKPFLLHGITGSGKTHVYIELSRIALDRGLSVIILVPEISLTPQTIQRFRDALGDRIAVIHSRMSDGERRDSIEEIVSGRKRIVIGVRSAILAPMDGVGLIIVDEEHDSSYKQEDIEPRFHARNVAVMRGFFQNAAVVLGGATPSFESYYNAVNGKYNLIELKHRFGKARLPTVRIVDMNREHKENNWTILSRYLAARIRQALDNGRQTILLLNRRGFSVSLICSDCGHIYSCPCCSVSLTYHRADSGLRCHQCGYFEPAPEKCVRCGGRQIKYKGTGIQKAEEFIHQSFEDARVIRMDQDSTRRKGAHISVLEIFEKREADILLGTQMVAKGLNFPGVSLVGVLQADIGLHFPDFRASERTYQLISQVAGRAGREDSLGEVVIQTYLPEEPCITASLTHDYTGFYNREIVNRETLIYPPFSRLARIVLEGNAENMVKEKVGNIADKMRLSGMRSISMLGPAPAVLSKIKNAYRYSILLKSSSTALLHRKLVEVRRMKSELSRNMKLTIDVDPLNML